MSIAPTKGTRNPARNGAGLSIAFRMPCDATRRCKVSDGRKPNLSVHVQPLPWPLQPLLLDIKGAASPLVIINGLHTLCASVLSAKSFLSSTTPVSQSALLTQGSSVRHGKSEYNHRLPSVKHRQSGSDDQPRISLRTTAK
jgi:hypothetical protein